MRLLLTSDGITSNALGSALKHLAYRPVGECRAAFIPTSSNLLNTDKRWLLSHMRQITRAGFAELDIVDIAALPRSTAEERLAMADVIVMGGGDTGYLMQALEENGVPDYLPGLLDRRVYVGISAGGIVAGPDTSMGSHTRLWTNGEANVGHPGLGLTEVRIRPHLNNPDFPEMVLSNIEVAAQQVPGPIHVLDDACAVQIIDDAVSVVGNGEHHVLA